MEEIWVLREGNFKNQVATELLCEGGFSKEVGNSNYKEMTHQYKVKKGDIYSKAFKKQK